MERLQGTQIKTDIQAGGEGQAGFFSWLSEAQLHYTTTKAGEKRLKAVKVRLCDWLYRAILRDRRVLDYDPNYFQLGPVERRLYEVARSACINGPVEIELEDLRLQLGYQSPLKQFRYVLKGIVDANAVPGFSFVLNDSGASSSDRRPKRSGGKDSIRITPQTLLQAG